MWSLAAGARPRLFLRLAALFFGVATGACASRPALPPPAPPAPMTGDKVLLEDHFAQYNPQWRQVRGQWAVAQGKLVQARDDAREGNSIFFYDPLTIADAEITAGVTVLARLPQFQTRDDEELLKTKRRIAGAGIVFRYQDDNNFYMFRLAGEEGAVLGRMQDGQWYDLANPRAADFAGVLVRMDTEYALRVRAEGRRIACWINNRAVASLDDSAFSIGRIGLATFRTQAAFSFIKVVER